jgi:hypothetical protein
MKQQPKYPIYVISKGRWETRLTVRALEEMECNHRIVVEPQEFNQYAAVINPVNILQTPFSNLGQGSIPVRNFVWEHAISEGHRRHWIIDDNINGFGRMNYNHKIRVKTPAPFCAVEDFTDRFENVRIAGMEYDYFLPRKTKLNPYRLNTRIYSCILIDNSLDFRWRGKYNEDTDLSLRVLKGGGCTVLFQAFFCFKVSTMVMKGGNEAIYTETDNRREFAESLKAQHPDIVKIVWRFDRWHHDIDYTVFRRNKLKLRKDYEMPSVPNEFGMILKRVRNDNISNTDLDLVINKLTN